MTHELKIWPIHWQRVVDGTKTFEIRKNDRFFQRGDKVILRPWSEEHKRYLEGHGYRNLELMIGDVYPIDSEVVVFSILKDSR